MYHSFLIHSSADGHIGKEEVKLSLFADDTTLMAENEEELKSLFMRMKEQSEKAA